MEEKIPLEIERRYLICRPADELLLAHARRRDVIQQTYLRPAEPDTVERVRLRGGAYTHTLKRRVDDLTREEREESIPEEQYRALLERADPDLSPLWKTRWCVPFGGHTLEIDTYPFWPDRALLEVELTDQSESPALPDWLEVVREVTGDGRYTNRALAAAVPYEPLPGEAAALPAVYKDPTKRTWAEVRLDYIEQNYLAMKARLPADTVCLGVVKADGYGHGALPVARRLQALDCGYLAVACLDEAYALRQGGITLPILILGPTPAAYAPDLAALGLTQTVSSLPQAQAYSRGLDRPLKIHVKLETGMGRTGFTAGDPAAMAELKAALALPWLDYEGIFTHFAVSDEAGDPYTAWQHERFLAAVGEAEAAYGKSFRLKHCMNSGALINAPQYAHDMARPGLALYGMYPGPETGGLALRPAMCLKSRVAAVTSHLKGDTISYGRTYTCPRDMRLAVLPIGYADGLHRALSGKLEVSLCGKRVPQVGRICMDLCMLDVTDVPDCRVGSVATVFGGPVPIEELAEKAGTINYELTCALTPRVPRVYLG